MPGPYLLRTPVSAIQRTGAAPSLIPRTPSPDHLTTSAPPNRAFARPVTALLPAASGVPLQVSYHGTSGC